MKNRASDKVYKYIEEKIIKKVWQAGDKITPEIELSKLLEVSRVSTREAIQKLVTLKVLIKKRGVGGGTFVNQPTPDDYLDNILPLVILGESSYSELMVIRSVLEPLSVKLFILNADEEDYRELQNIHNKMVSSSGDMLKFLKYDILFHRFIARSTKNSMLDKILEIILNMNEHYAHDIYSGFSYDKNIQDHENILYSINNKEIETGIIFMKNHIQRKIKGIENYDIIKKSKKY